MKRYTLLTLLIIIICCVVAPVSALVTNNTGAQITLISTSFVHDISYIPTWMEVMFIIIGFLALLFSKWEPIEDIFSLVACVAFAVSAWYANFMYEAQMAIAIPSTTTTITADSISAIYTEVIVPNPVLSIFMTICTIFAFINALYIYFYKPAQGKIEGGGESGEQPQE